MDVIKYLRMRCFSLFLAGLFCSNFAFGANYHCLKEVAGRTACVAGEMMVCVKKYDSSLHDFTYERRGVNNAGQSFEISQNSMYKKLAGFTPATCTDMASSEMKPLMATAKISKPNAKPMLAVVKPLRPIAKPIRLVAHPTPRLISKPVRLAVTVKPTHKPIQKPSKLAAKHMAKPIAKSIKLATKSTKPIAKSVRPIDKQPVTISLQN